jgi:cyclic pyranopterin phosphate synthase
MKKLTHTNSKGKASIVDVSLKNKTLRRAKASAKVILSPEAFKAVLHNSISKGDVISTAKLAGIMAAKRTSELIPLCHNISISHIELNLEPDSGSNTIRITGIVSANDVTGVEMEALTAVTISALTIYDMCKAIDKSIVITAIQLLEKSGGKNGKFKRGKLYE